MMSRLSSMISRAPATTASATTASATTASATTPTPPLPPSSAVECATPATLTLTLEKQALSHGTAHRLVGMASLKAPTTETAAEEEQGDGARLPIELVAVVDRSGSMSGKNMQLMKETLELLVNRGGLTAKDKFGLVSFDSVVKVELGLQSMSEAGRAEANSVIRKLHTGGTTNLSGGVLQGIDLVAQSIRADVAAAAAAAATPTAATRAVFLFTDGHANVGIKNTDKLVSAVQGALGGNSMGMFTFGFGANHNEDMLQAVAGANNGTGAGGSYYFIDSAEAIPASFADALGGLMSTVAQNATLTLTTNATDGGSISKVHGKYTTTKQSATTTVITIGDLYEDDNKDVLFNLELGAITAEAAAVAGAAQQATLKATLRYFCVTTGAFVHVNASIHVARPAETPDGQTTDPKLEDQKNRIAAASAMEAAAKLADKGQVKEGRTMLLQMLGAIKQSKVSQSATSQALSDDLNNLQMGYASASVYRQKGGKASKMMAQSHQQQRSNHVSAKCYAGKKKRSMKRSWGLAEE